MYYILIFSLSSKRKKCSLLQVACLNQIYNASSSSLCSPNFIALMLAVLIPISSLLLELFQFNSIFLNVTNSRFTNSILLYEVPLSTSFRTLSLFSTISTFLLLFAARREDNSSAMLLLTYSSRFEISVTTFTDFARVCAMRPLPEKRAVLVSGYARVRIIEVRIIEEALYYHCTLTKALYHRDNVSIVVTRYYRFLTKR